MSIPLRITTRDVFAMADRFKLRRPGVGYDSKTLRYQVNNGRRYLGSVYMCLFPCVLLDMNPHIYQILTFVL